LKISQREGKIAWNFVRYGNCWEDADVLLEALQVKNGGVYLSIASSGDNSLSMAGQGAGRIIAVDLNPAQIACVEIRTVLFKSLSYPELLGFLGVSPMENRLSVFQGLKGLLSSSGRSFWESRQKDIEEGIIYSGKFEHYFRIFRKWVLPLIHRKATVRGLLEEKPAPDRAVFFQQHWNTWRWRMIFRIFFSRFIMGHLGRDPKFFKYVQGEVAARILKRTEHALTILPTHSNPYLQFILTGGFQAALPHYLRRDNFDSIRANLDVLECRQCPVAGILKESTKFDGFNLSDIFEYMSPDQYAAELNGILSRARPGARLVFWNMLADRSCPSAFLDRLRPLTDLSSRLLDQNKAFFYKSLHIEEVL